MSRVRIHDSNDGPWQTLGELTPAPLHKHFTALELATQVFMHEEGDEQTLQLTEVRYPPHTSINPHAHEHDEIFFVVDGELHAGGRVLGRGGSLFVAADTIYSLKAGEAGAHVVVFRAVRDMSYIPQEQWAGRRPG